MVFKLDEISQSIPYIQIPIGTNPNIAAIDNEIFVYSDSAY